MAEIKPRLIFRRTARRGRGSQPHVSKRKKFWRIHALAPSRRRGKKKGRWSGGAEEAKVSLQGWSPLLMFLLLGTSSLPRTTASSVSFWPAPPPPPSPLSSHQN